MRKATFTNLIFIKAVIWSILFFSTLALVYHIRWFIPFLQNVANNKIPIEQNPLVGFIVQICNNLIFLLVGFGFLRLIRRYQQTGFFEKESLKILDVVIASVITLALLGAFQTVTGNFYDVHFNDWTSIESVANLLFRSFTRLLIFKEPQTMYLFLALILWVVKQFVVKALFIKNENEAFV